MYEGKVVIFVHPVDRSGIECRIAGANREKGITLVNANCPEEIMFCSTPSDYGFDKDFEHLVRAIVEGKEFDPLKAYMGDNPLRQLAVLGALRHLILEKQTCGSSQAELLERCPFK